MRITKKHIFLIAIVATIFLGGVGYTYLRRPVKAPNELAIEYVGPEQGQKAYSISQEKSKAEFRIDEVLRGEEVTVIGVTDAILGEIYFDLSAPAKLSLTPIRINARTLKTDSQNRNTAIARFILKSESDANEFIVFTPRQYVGLPENLQEG